MTREEELQRQASAYAQWVLSLEDRVVGRELPEHEDAGEWDVELRAIPEEHARFLEAAQAAPVRQRPGRRNTPGEPRSR